MTYMGYFAALLGVVLFFWSRTALYCAFVFSLPFSATAVMNIGAGDAASGVQVWMFFGLLWLCRELMPQATALKIILRRPLYSPAACLAAFVLVAVLSTLMPLWINGSLHIIGEKLLDNSTSPLLFSRKNITGLLYLLFGVLIALGTAQMNSSLEDVRRSLRALVISGVFISFWGLLQMTCYIIHVPYPSAIFNNSETPSALGYLTEFGDLNVKRISSVAVEPSMLAEVLLAILPVILLALLFGRPIFSKRMDFFCGALMMLVLLLTTSSTAYVGLAAMMVLVPASLATMRVFTWGSAIRRVFVWIFAASAAAIAAWAMSSAVRGVVANTLLNKTSSFSAAERVKSIYYAAQYFQQYPLLGIGWGSVGSHDLVMKLLSNTGVIGLLAFAGFVVTILLGLRRVGRTNGDPLSDYAVVSFISILILVFMNTLIGFAYVFGHFWFVLGLGMAVGFRRMSISK
jgi:hypothetical protein